MVAPRELRMQVYVDNPILNAAGSRTAPLHSCTSVVGGSELWPELEEGPEGPESRTDLWRIQSASRWSQCATRRSENAGCKGFR